MFLVKTRLTITVGAIELPSNATLTEFQDAVTKAESELQQRLTEMQESGLQSEDFLEVELRISSWIPLGHAISSMFLVMTLNESMEASIQRRIKAYADVIEEAEQNLLKIESMRNGGKIE